MEFALRLAFWQHFLSIQLDSLSHSEADQHAHTGFQSSDFTHPELFPETARTRFYLSEKKRQAKDYAAALSLAFQALEICNFTHGILHPCAVIVMKHIAEICDLQGLSKEAQTMRNRANSILYLARPVGHSGN